MSGPAVTLQNPARFRGLALRRLRPWVRELAASRQPTADSLTVRFVDDEEMGRLQREFRGREGTTDILSFDGDRTPEGWHLGDLVISVPVARRQARDFGHGLGREIRELILHGLLHLEGHDHETDDGAMRRLELRLRRRWIPAAEDEA